MHRDAELEAAHRKCGNHRAEILASDLCGCFHCLATFSPTEILDWIDEDVDDVGRTALCPRCGIDSVIGSSSGISTDVEFLSRMHAYWFGRSLSGAEAEAELRARRLARRSGDDASPSVPPESKKGG